MHPGINSRDFTDMLLRDRLCLELIIVSNDFLVLLFFQDNLPESVWKHEFQK